MAGIHLHQITQPGQQAPGVGFEAPFEMLNACHERVERMLRLLGKLREHVKTHGADNQARDAARDVMRYFDQAGPHHHEDEERHVFPPLLAQRDPAVLAVVIRLKQDHREMAVMWALVRAALSTLVGAGKAGPVFQRRMSSASMPTTRCTSGIWWTRTAWYIRRRGRSSGARP